MLRALGDARLAEAAGDPATALAALEQLVRAGAGAGAVDQRIVEQALLIGAFRPASEAAARLWAAGERRLELRLILAAGAARRGDWPGLRAYLADDTGGDERDAAVMRLVAPVLLGWADVAQRAPDPAAQMRAAPPGASDATTGWLGASMAAATGRVDAAAIAAIPLDSRSAVQVAARLARTIARRDAVAAAALDARIAATGALADDPTLDPAMIRRVASPAQGMAQWLTLLADSIDRTDGGNARLTLIFARAAHWLDGGDPPARLVLAGALAANAVPELGLSAIGGQGGRADRTLPAALAMRAAELAAADGQSARALALAEQAVASRPGDIGLLLRHAELLRRAGDGAAILAGYDRLLAEIGGSDGPAPDAKRLFVAVKVAKADQLIKQDQWPAARAALTDALAVLPNDPEALNYLGYSALERREDPASALAMIERAWQQEPENAAITDSLGWAHFLLGNYDRAVPLLEMAVRGDPASAVIEEHLGDAYWRAERRIDARFAWTSAALNAEDAAMQARLAAKLRDGLTDATVAP